VEQSQKRIKIMTERSMKVLRELEKAAGEMENEYKRYTADLDVAKRDLEKLRRDREHKLEDLRRLEN
jgi:hypothetical protein